MSNKLTIALITSLLTFSFGLPYQSFGDEGSEIRKEMQELRRQMEIMQKRLDELEERNRILEEETRKQKEEREVEKALEETAPPPSKEGRVQRVIQSLNPDISVIGTFAAAYFSEDEVTERAEIDPEDTGVNLQEVEIAFSGSIDPFFRFDSFFSIGREGIEIEEAYATTQFSLPLGLQFRTGLFRSKFGRINTQHRHFQDFVTLALPASRFLGEHLNPVGIELNILPQLPWFLEMSASVNSPEVETLSFDRDDDNNDIRMLLYVFHIKNFFELSDDLSVILGGSFATGANGIEEGNRTNLWGADLFAKYRPLRGNPYQELSLQSEFMFRNAQARKADLNDWGIYAQLVYRFARRWNAGFRFDFVETDNPLEMPDEDEQGEAQSLLSLKQSEEEEELGLFGDEFRYTFMLTFTPSEFSRVRLQYEYTDPDFLDDTHALYLQFRYSLGAHGAHPF